jgi:hypothetical protein
MNKARKLIDQTSVALVESTTIPREVRLQELINIQELGKTLDEVSRAEERGDMPPGERLKAERLACGILKLTQAAGNAGLLAMAIAGSVTQTRIAMEEFGAVVADMDLDWEEDEPQGGEE